MTTTDNLDQEALDTLRNAQRAVKVAQYAAGLAGWHGTAYQEALRKAMEALDHAAAVAGN